MGEKEANEKYDSFLRTEKALIEERNKYRDRLDNLYDELEDFQEMLRNDGYVHKFHGWVKER